METVFIGRLPTANSNVPEIAFSLVFGGVAHRHIDWGLEAEPL